MAKRLNKNLVVGLTLTGMVLTTAAGVVMVRALPVKSPKQFLKQAQELEAKGEPGDLTQAATYYQRAAARARAGNDMPAACEYLTKAGDLLLASGDSASALKIWNGVVRADPSQITAQEKIVKFYLEISDLSTQNKNWIELQSQAEKLIAAAEQAKTTSYVGLHALGRALINLREVKESNFAEGKKKLIQAVNGDKSNPDYAKALAVCYLQEAQTQAGQSKEANQLVKDAFAVLDTAIANAPKDPEQQAKAFLYRGKFYGSPQASLVYPDADQKAQADLQKAVELSPKNEDAGTGLGLFWYNKMLTARKNKAPPAEIEQYHQKARESLVKAVQADPDHYVSYIQLATMYLEDKQFDEAIKVLDERLKRPLNRESYQSWRNRHYLAYIHETNFKANLGKFVQIAENAKTPEEVKAQQAAVLDRLKELQNQALAELGDQNSLVKFMQGRLAFLQNDTFGSIKALEAAEKLNLENPNPEIERLLAILYTRTNSAGAADKAVGIVLAADPNDPATLILQANVKNQLGKPQDAIYAADKALALSPENVEALRAKGQALAALKRYDELAEITRILSKGVGKDREQLSNALILQQEAMSTTPIDEKKLAQAVALYQEILKQDPTNSAAYLRLAQILAQKPEGISQANKVLDDAKAALEKKLKEVAQTQPSGDQARNLARAILSTDLMKIDVDPALTGDAKAEEKMKRKEEIVRKESDPFVAIMTLYQLHSNANKTEEAMRDMKEAYRLKPDDPAVLESMLQMAIGARDWKLAEEATNRAIATGLEKSGGHIYRGQILLARSQEQPSYRAEAEREFRAAIAEMPEFAEGYAQLGRALLSQNLVSDARAAFEKALQLNPMNAYALVGMAILVSGENNEQEKQRYLMLASQAAPNNSWVQSQLQLLEDTRDPLNGITRREQIRKTNPKDVENLVRLAELYKSANKLDAASQPYEEALKIPPLNLEIATLYARLFLSRDPPDVKGAMALFDRIIQETDPKDSQRKGAAQLLQAELLAGLATLPKVKPPAQAEIDQAFETAAKTSPTYDILFNVGQYYISTRRVPEALKRFRQARDSAEAAGQKVQRRTAQQLIVGTLLGTVTPEGYDETMREIEAFRKAYPDDSLGILYNAGFQSSTGHDADAIKAYTEFISRDPQNAAGYVRRGLAWIRRGDWEAAIKDFKEAKQRNPRAEGGRPRILLINALEQTKQDATALAEAQGLADDMPESIDALRTLFNLYIKMKRYDGAESLVNARSQRSLTSPIWDDWRRRIAMARKDNDGALRYAFAAMEKSRYQDGSLVDTFISMLLLFQKYDQAIDFIDHKLPQEGRSDYVVLREASAYASKGDTGKAIDLYEKAVSTPPVDLSLLQTVMSSDPGLQAHSDAVAKEIEARYQKDPKGRNTRILALVYRLTRGDTEGAAKLAHELAAETSDKSPELDTERSFFLRGVALIEFQLKHYAEARDWYKKVLEKNPKEAVSLNNLAFLLMDRMNDPASALAYARTATEVIPDNPPTAKAAALDTLGWNLVLLGQNDEAISRLGRALELDPSIGEARYHLAEAFYRRSQKAVSSSAASDVEESKKQLRAADAIMVPGRPDPDNIREKMKGLADKLGVKLAQTGDATQTQPAH